MKLMQGRSEQPAAGLPDPIALYSAMCDGIQAGLIILDRDYHILRSNLFVQNWLKRSPEELLDQQCFRVIHDREEICADCPAAVTFQTGSPAHVIHTGLDKEGEATYAEISTHPVGDAAGAVTYVIEYVRDVSERVHFERELLREITERKQAEEQLRERNDELAVLNAVAAATTTSLELQEILEGALDSVLHMMGLRPMGGIFVLDEAQHLLRLVAHRGLAPEFVAQERTIKVGECLCGLAAGSGELLYSADSLLDEGHTHPSAEPHAHVIVPLKSHDRVQGILFLYPPRDHLLGPSDLSLFPTIGRQIGVAIENARLYERTDAQLQTKVAELTAALEAAERERAKAEQVEQLKDDYVKMISHDLRTPLTIIQAQAQIVQRFMGDPAQVQRSAASIVTSVRRMNGMIQDLTDSARLEAGQAVLEKRPLQLSSFVSELLASASGAIDPARVKLEIAPGLPAVAADPDRLARILLNLLTNAVKYSPAEAEVRLRIARLGGEVVTSVTDRGVGIAPEDLPHVFERFYRARAARKTDGLGLGLYITRMLVEAHGGRLWAESEPGQGSTFSFTLRPAHPLRTG